MGLDGLELIMAVEEKFGIDITDEEATKVVTVGDLKRLVTAKLEVAVSDGCLTQRAFHLIRKKAIAEFGVLRRNLKPDTSLETIVPETTRRESWQNFQVALGVAGFPELVRSNTGNLMIMILAFFSIAVPVWYGALHPPHLGLWALFGVVLGPLVALGLAWLTRPMRTEFRAGHDKVGDLARFLVANYPQQIGKPRTSKWAEEEISCLLREVIIDELAVTKFDDDSRFVQDLRID